MKILLVAFSGSIHTARWVSQIAHRGWELHLFPSLDTGFTHPELQNASVYHTFFPRQAGSLAQVKLRGIPMVHKGLAYVARRTLNHICPDFRLKQLVRLIRRIQPDIVHSMEIQSGGYLALDAKRILKDDFPAWIVTNWGSDIYLFGRLRGHRERIRKVLQHCDFYSCECERDVQLARDFGFRGGLLPVFPNCGGFDLEGLQILRKDPPSVRRGIMLKGYQNWAGRSLVGLRALRRCADLLNGYTLYLYSAGDDVRIAAELFEHETGVRTEIIPENTPNERILAYHGRSRISIGLSISDAISTSMLEAMIMGSFPIQSNTACADEWLTDRINGMLVPPEDPETIEDAIRAALTDNRMVDEAAQVNEVIARQRLDARVLNGRVIDFYQRAFREARRA